MLTQKDVDSMVNGHFIEMQNCLNSIEKEITEGGDELNKPSISFYFGKIQEHFKILSKLLKIDYVNK